ncbi:hypothetical protein ACIA78_21510 [Streptomyces xanthochromogenes]
MQAYSGTTRQTYPSWEDRLATVHRASEPPPRRLTQHTLLPGL